MTKSQLLTILKARLFEMSQIDNPENEDYDEVNPNQYHEDCGYQSAVNEMISFINELEGLKC